MPNLWGCNGCRPIRTRECVDDDSNLAEVLGEICGYGVGEIYFLGSPYGPDTCGNFADFLENKAAESDDEVSISAERIEEIRNGAELTPEEEEEYKLEQENQSYSYCVTFVSIEDEKGETLHFVVDLVDEGKGCAWDSASGPYTAEEYEKLRASYEAEGWWS